MAAISNMRTHVEHQLADAMRCDANQGQYPDHDAPHKPNARTCIVRAALIICPPSYGSPGGPNSWSPPQAGPGRVIKIAFILRNFYADCGAAKLLQSSFVEYLYAIREAVYKYMVHEHSAEQPQHVICTFLYPNSCIAWASRRVCGFAKTLPS